MKILFFALALILSLQAHALTCWDRNSGLMVSVQKKSGMVYFNFSAGRGYQSIPQFEGPVSPNDFRMLQFQADSLQGLGDSFEIEIPAGKCDLTSPVPGIFTCYAEGEISGKSLNYSSLTGYRVKQTHVSGEFETQHFRLMIGKEDRFFFVIPFPQKDCHGGF